MDSLDFYRTLLPEPTRGATDVMLDNCLAWVGAWVTPERIYTADQLAAWALRNGYERRDSSDLVALLREAYPYVDHPSMLATAINDAIAARRAV